MPLETVDSPISIDHLLDQVSPSNAQISPDGQWVAFEVGTANKADKATPYQRAIYLANTQSGSFHVLAEGDTNGAMTWSPDSQRLAFVSNRADHDETQLYVASITDGTIQGLTNLRGVIDAPAWSPDGSHIAFLYSGTLNPQKLAEADHIVYEQGTPFNRVWLLELATKAVQAVTLDSLHVHEYAWSPDSSRLAIVASSHPNPFEGWYSAQVYAVDLVTGVLTQLCQAPQQVGRLAWSPDGESVAFVMGVMSDEGNVSGEVYRVPARGGEMRGLTPGIDHSITWIQWRDAGILYGARGLDNTIYGWIDPNSGETRLISSGRYGVNGFGAQALSVSQAGRFAAVRESFEEPPTVYVGSLDTGEWSPLVALPQESLGPMRVENRHWHNPDGTPVHGFLVFPANYTPGKRYPLFLHVHGGPSWSYVPRYGSHWERMMASLGCFVLMPNPRGSWGRGHAYQAANVGDLGGGDWQDINAGVDALIAEGLVDSERMVIGGWSYGGYLVAWAVTQTDRFRCAIAGASITNYESNYGVVKNREWQTTMFGSDVYTDTERHRAQSPMTHVRNVKTPTLLVHGLEDIYAPPQQSIEFYVALRHLGIPTELVLYPREPHGFEERAHQRDLYERITLWVQRYLFSDE